MPLWPTLSPRGRRVLQAVLYELFAITAVGPALGALFDEPLASSLGLAVLMSTVALLWSLVFNTLFERWEAGRPVKGRSWRRRALHGLGFEGGLALMLTPLVAVWLHLGLGEAFVANLGVMLFFLGYAVVFTWAFDRVFGLPASARG